MSHFHRGIVLSLYRVVHHKTTRTIAEELGVSYGLTRQIIAGERRGGPEFWQKFELATGISVEDVDKFIARHLDRDPKEIMKRLIKS